MNREILFRGKCVDNGKWVEGNHLYDEITDKHYIVPFGNINESEKVGQEGCCYCVGFEVIPETVGQYTGLTDKNDKKIFKGDIVRYNNTIYEIAYITDIARFGGRKPKVIMSIFPLEDSKVIGNIHDNSELLEVSE